MRKLLIFSGALVIACGTMQPRLGMTFNELYGQVAQAGCGWLELESKKDDVTEYHVALSKPGCNPKIHYHFYNDELVKIE